MKAIVDMYNKELNGLGKAALINGCCVISGIYPDCRPQEVLPYEVRTKIQISVGNTYVIADTFDEAKSLWGTKHLPGTSFDGDAFVFNNPVITARNPRFESVVRGYELKVRKPLKGLFVWCNHNYFDAPLRIESDDCIIKEITNSSYWSRPQSCITQFYMGEYDFRLEVTNVLKLRKSNDYVQVVIPGKLYTLTLPLHIDDTHTPLSGMICNNCYDPEVMKYYNVVNSHHYKFAPFSYAGINTWFAHCTDTDEDIYIDYNCMRPEKLNILDLKALAEMTGGSVENDVLTLPGRWNIKCNDINGSVTYEPHKTMIHLNVVSPLPRTNLYTQRVANSVPVCPGLCTIDPCSISNDLENVDVTKYSKYIEVHKSCYIVRGASASLGTKVNKRVLITRQGYTTDEALAEVGLTEDNILLKGDKFTIYSKHKRDARNLTLEWCFKGDCEAVYEALKSLPVDNKNIVEVSGHRAFVLHNSRVPGYWYVRFNNGYVHGPGRWAASEARWWREYEDNHSSLPLV